jgi:serine/threonine-protein phosphatase 6 regulatory ankyrin repeat subunit B
MSIGREKMKKILYCVALFFCGVWGVAWGMKEENEFTEVDLFSCINDKDLSTLKKINAEKIKSLVNKKFQKISFFYDNTTSPYKANDLTPLHFAVLKEDIDIIKFLIEIGAEKELPIQCANEAQRISGLTPLHFAIKLKYPKITEFLLDNGANIETTVNNPGNTYNGFTPLHLAIYEDLFDIVKILIEKGANIEAIVNNIYYICDGFTALHLAIYKNNKPIFTFLREKGAKIDAKVSVKNYEYSGMNASTLAQKASNNNIYPIFKREEEQIEEQEKEKQKNEDLLEKIKEKEILKKEKEKPATDFFNAIQKGDISKISEETISELINNTLNFESLDKKYKGFHPLDLAIEKNQTSVALALIKKGANIKKIIYGYESSVYNGFVPLHMAIEKGNKEIFDAIINNKEMQEVLWNKFEAPINTKIENEKSQFYGFIPLHLAIEKNKLEMVKALIARTDTLINDQICENEYQKSSYYNFTPILMAIEKGYNEIALALLQKDIAGNFGSIDKCIENNTAKSEYNSLNPLLMALVKGNDYIAIELLNKKADFNKTINNESNEYNGFNALHLVIEKFNPELTVEVIKNYEIWKTQDTFNNPIKKNKKNPYNGFTALHLAIFKNELEIVKALMNQKVISDTISGSINTKITNNESTYNEYTPLDLALERSSNDITKLLRKNGANAYKHIKQEEEIQNKKEKKAQTIKELFLNLVTTDEKSYENIKDAIEKNKFNINKKDTDGYTLLLYALFNFDVKTSKDNYLFKIVEYLIAKGADLEITYDGNVFKGELRGFTPLHMAAYSGNKAITEHLINSGAKNDTLAKKSTRKFSEKTPYQVAESEGYTELLTIDGFNPNEKKKKKKPKSINAPSPEKNPLKEEVKDPLAESLSLLKAKLLHLAKALKGK